MRGAFRLISPVGRARRLEFVGVTIGAVAAELLAVELLHVSLSFGLTPSSAALVYLASLVVVGWVAVAAVIRRLHDLGETSGLLGVAVLVALGLAWLAAANWMGHGWPTIWAMALLLAAAYLFLAVRRGMAGLDDYEERPARKAVPADDAAAAAQCIRVQMHEMATPTLLLAPTSKPGFSKLGGKPELPDALAWPSGAKSARIFLAQLDLAEVRSAGGPEWLPDRGRVYVFYDEDGWESLQLATCLFTDDPAGSPRNAPEGYEPDPMFAERRVGFTRLTSLPSLDWLEVSDTASLLDADFDELADAPDEPFGEGPQHRLAGYPSEIQGSQMALECEFRARGLKENYNAVPAAVRAGAKDWRLLLQVDTDNALGMKWGDTGRLYVFIREQDAQAGDFSKTATIWQTC